MLRRNPIPQLCGQHLLLLQSAVCRISRNMQHAACSAAHFPNCAFEARRRIDLNFPLTLKTTDNLQTKSMIINTCHARLSGSGLACSSRPGISPVGIASDIKVHFNFSEADRKQSQSTYELGLHLHPSQPVSALLDFLRFASRRCVDKFAATHSSIFSNIRSVFHLLIQSTSILIVVFLLLDCWASMHSHTILHINISASIQMLDPSSHTRPVLRPLANLLILHRCSCAWCRWYVDSYVVFFPFLLVSFILLRQISSYKWSEVGSRSTFSGRKLNACG